MVVAIVLAVLAALAACDGEGVGEPGGGLSGDGGNGSETSSGGGTSSGGETSGGTDGVQLPDQESGVILGAAFAGGTAHDFEVVRVGGSRRVSIQVRTTFDLLPFRVTGVSVSGTFFALVDGSACQGVVLTGDAPSCQVLVSYAPTSAGTHEGLFSTTGVTATADSSTATATPTAGSTASAQQRTATLRLVGVGA
jgi:hypothetical protein